MGNYDTSWISMKRFLGNKSVKVTPSPTPNPSPTPSPSPSPSPSPNPNTSLSPNPNPSPIPSPYPYPYPQLLPLTKDELINFDSRKITPEIRDSVTDILQAR